MIGHSPLTHGANKYIFICIMTISIVCCHPNSIYILIDEAPLIVNPSDCEFEPLPKECIIAFLPKGDKVEYLWKTYTKESMYYKVKTKDGIKGYIKYNQLMKIKN